MKPSHLALLLLMLLLSDVCLAARKGGSRRRGKHKKQRTGSPRLIALSPKSKAYYENENVSLLFDRLFSLLLPLNARTTEETL